MRLGHRLGVLLVALGALATVPACANDPASDGTIRFALDWTPNTNHTGLYVAIREGLFEQAGLDVEILPYSNTTPDLLIDAGAAEFGISTHSQATFSRAAGSDTVTVLAPLQHRATAIGVRADRADLQSPRDLDGLTYAGFGDPGDNETLSQVIRNDGGTGEFTSVVLGTSAYEAVYSGTADFTVSYVAWEGLEAQHRGLPMRYFAHSDYGFPDAYSIVVDGNETWMSEHPDSARAFIQALQQGYRIAADDPQRGAQHLIDADPGLFTDESLVFESQQMLSADYMRDDSGQVGTLDLERWSGYSRFLFEAGLLAGADGATLTEEPDWSAYFTDAYLAP
ncbi:MAG: ABC transporter substrate-binding protein [Rhodococcus sp.]|nr:ABC transporter substrate-binding protein [Rhodococcus sp. (in: high G+C Gram-positive bacteria)]NME80433.1 ABC transporter substrate-binding protein [Rhodococcus sp. 105337]